MDWGILGHQWAVDLLAAHLSGGRVRHAYLFTGPAGIGRRTLALRFTQALNCTQPPSPGAFCGDCRECRQTELMQHPDLAVVQAEGGTLKVDQVRDLQTSLHLAPYQARYRVALLLGFEQANPNAANALLKTLEEPPPQVVLCLTASSGDHLLPTIVSRCEEVRLRPVPAAQLGVDLQSRWGVEADLARLVAHLSNGRPGYARRLAEHPELLENRGAWLDDHRSLLTANRGGRFDYLQSLEMEREELQAVLLTWISFWHDVLRQAAGAAAPTVNLDREVEIAAVSGQVDLASAHRALTALDRTLAMLETNVNRRLAMEVLMLDLPTLAALGER